MASISPTRRTPPTRSGTSSTGQFFSRGRCRSRWMPATSSPLTWKARLIRHDYIWSWKTRVLDQGQSGADKANFTQSTFFGAPLSPATLQKRAASYTPTLSEDGRIARFVLESMNDGMSLGEIARLVSTEFSARFPRPDDALSSCGGPVATVWLNRRTLVGPAGSFLATRTPSPPSEDMVGFSEALFFSMHVHVCVRPAREAGCDRSAGNADRGRT